MKNILLYNPKDHFSSFKLYLIKHLIKRKFLFVFGGILSIELFTFCYLNFFVNDISIAKLKGLFSIITVFVLILIAIVLIHLLFEWNKILKFQKENEKINYCSLDDKDVYQIIDMKHSSYGVDLYAKNINNKLSIIKRISIVYNSESDLNLFKSYFK